MLKSKVFFELSRTTMQNKFDATQNRQQEYVKNEIYGLLLHENILFCL